MFALIKQPQRFTRNVYFRELSGLSRALSLCSTRSFSTEVTVETLLREIQTQGIKVRELKQGQASSTVIMNEVEKLKALKSALKLASEPNEQEKQDKMNLRTSLEDLLVRKFFYVPSFEIYGGVSGLYDYGPPGCALMSNLQSQWRKHFVLTENMLEVSCASLTPEIVLKTSGHVDRFTDLMVSDLVTKDYYRADKLLEEVAEKLLESHAGRADPVYVRELNLLLATAGSFGVEETKAAILKYNITSPHGNALSEPAPFNLMFKTEIGPTGKYAGYLRPETAQGIFVNFRRLYEYNNRRLPFGAAQIGLAYRNEIAPRAGLLRVREFPLAEIEHFVNPENKNHVRFNEVADYHLDLLPRALQDGVNPIVTKTVHEAVLDGTIDNETLAYFMARTHKFLVDCGIDPSRLRFRQHLHTEMAHYATDCWDAEILTSQGWIECVGHADRSAFDLRVHAEASKVDLSAHEALTTPILETKLVCKPNMGTLAKDFRSQSSYICEYLKKLSQDDLVVAKQSFDQNGLLNVEHPEHGVVCLTNSHISFLDVEVKTYSKSYIPSVIEPSFGLGRIIYSILEHAYYVRDGDEQRKVLGLSPVVAPIKVSLCNVLSNIDFAPIVSYLRNQCVLRGITFQEDTSKTSIGRKYARSDEIGTPFTISIDSESCEPSKKLVTLRERDSMKQVQLPLEDVVTQVEKLCSGLTTWDEVYAMYPKFNSVSNEHV